MSDVTIKANDNGPFLVTGSVKVVDSEGNAFDTGGKEVIALCRCGASANNPFCDGAHKTCDFQSVARAN